MSLESMVYLESVLLTGKGKSSVEEDSRELQINVLPSGQAPWKGISGTILLFSVVEIKFYCILSIVIESIKD